MGEEQDTRPVHPKTEEGDRKNPPQYSETEVALCLGTVGSSGKPDSTG